ncbi:MAG: hypothetical protein R2765_05935 [Ferruginibacter sp.]|nr:hypothetical protein [Bacteroidota bacterium]MBX2920530.1 hypothetical protein [Ferruginibacter sp.]MCB0708455.1 hypothetical protein [Chitinophagaceae bacterium]
MKKIFFALLNLSLVLVSCAQTKCTVKKAYAFYTVTIAGAAIADENGNIIPPKPQINRFIYLEVTGTKEPVVERIMYDSILYKSTIERVVGNIVVPVETNSENAKYSIRVKKKNSLWKIELQPADENKLAKEGATDINISFKYSNKSCTYKIKEEILLQTAPRY